MTREVKNGKVAFKGGRRGTSSTVREKIFGGISGAMMFQ